MSDHEALEPDQAPSWLATNGPLIKIRLVVGGLLLVFISGLCLAIGEIVTFWWATSILMLLYF